MRIRLGDDDRARLGCEEYLDAAVDTLTVRQAEEIEETLGLSPRAALDELEPRREAAANGTEQWRLTPRALRLLAWLALHRAGVRTPLREFDFDLLQLQLHQDETAASNGGKASSSDAGTTSSPSSPAGRRTRPKTSKTST